MLRYQLSRPFAYITIQHPSKRWVDLWFPLFLAFIISILSLLAKPYLKVWDTGGMITSIQSVIQILPGFYIAAFAAIIAVGNNQQLDEYIKNGQYIQTVKMYTSISYEKQDMPLTRRHFLCLLFAYLTAVSLILCIVSPIIMNFIPAILSLNLSLATFGLLSFVATGLYFFFIFQIVFITLFGLFYIAEKMHA
ncbi:hypothetical protein [Pelistega sp. MC2]|uniref:hypothetical protein n=1 Tax=Pelistega sp. MC2 TaxID=1720297 RepID=UPI0008D9D3E5|nr:hypothetical protein [Pelistega sp. MC2]